jgi:AmmeMemoRadiSam system protein A
MNADDARGEILLTIARAAIARELGRYAHAAEDASWLQQPGATFVTLRQASELRGCIGSLEPRRALVDDVKANAVSAAFRDPRFRPLQLAELDQTQIEVSLLSALEPIAFQNEQQALQQLEPGVHGVTFEYGYHKSTFLPQVWEDLRDMHEFIAHLKQKAGLPPDFWDPEVKLARYTVSKWSEKP